MVLIKRFVFTIFMLLCGQELVCFEGETNPLSNQNISQIDRELNIFYSFDHPISLSTRKKIANDLKLIYINKDKSLREIYDLLQDQFINYGYDSFLNVFLDYYHIKTSFLFDDLSNYTPNLNFYILDAAMLDILVQFIYYYPTYFPCMLRKFIEYGVTYNVYYDLAKIYYVKYGKYLDFNRDNINKYVYNNFNITENEKLHYKAIPYLIKNNG